MTDTRRRPGPSGVHGARESGVAMIGTLLVVIILGILVTIVLASNKSTPQDTTQGTTSSGAPVTTTTVPQSVGSGAEQAAIAACQLNFQAITTAIMDYRALNGTNPAAGTAWVTSSSMGGPYMQTWPNGNPYYILQWTGTALNVLPLHGTASHGSIGSKATATGCFAA